LNARIEKVKPATAQAVSELLARCDRDGQKVAIAGGNTLEGMGYTPERIDVTLETKSLNKIVDYERADLTIAAQCGVNIRTIAALLAKNGQFIPFDAPKPQYATLGGTLAAGWLGPRRHLYGRPRDYILGSTVVLADGTIAKAGGMVVKNVAGYDMSRLYTGSFGTLGVLVQANLKTLASPERSRVFLARLPEGTYERACAVLQTLAIRPAGAVHVFGFHTAIDGDDGQEGRLVILLEGSSALLERATRDLRSAIGKAGVPETRIIDSGARESFERVVDAYIANLGERSVTYRFHCLVDQSNARATAAYNLAHRYELRSETILDIMNGDVILRVSDLDTHALGAKIEIFDEELHKIEPYAQVIASEHPNRNNLNVWGQPPAAIDRMRALKMRFDPNSTLNPGRFVGGI
jgi:glycolate oxidase FAD binding subunit